jgi:hypothetical protein
MIGVNNKMVKFCKLSLEEWSIEFQLKTGTGVLQSRSIKINRDISGDSLSSLPFCISPIRLTRYLNRSKCGYHVYGTESKISHLLYMDDLRLIWRSEEELRNEIRILKTTSMDMRTGLN